MLHLCTLLAKDIFTGYLVVTIPHRKSVHCHLRSNTSCLLSGTRRIRSRIC